MAKERILVVEDEDDILELIQYNLEREGYQVLAVQSGEDGLLQAQKHKPELILLDIMLPSMSGLDVCKSLKADPATAHIPVVIVSARGEEADIVAGLEVGADDYVTKPFSPRVLVARTRAVLRRKTTPLIPETTLVELHELKIDPIRHEVAVGADLLSLTATEFRILHYLARHPGWVFTRHQIVQAVHGSDYPVTDRSIDVQIAGLRKKLGRLADYVETVRGIGYRMKE